jgi:hypothetical protein
VASPELVQRAEASADSHSAGTTDAERPRGEAQKHQQATAKRVLERQTGFVIWPMPGRRYRVGARNITASDTIAAWAIARPMIWPKILRSSLLHG